MGSVEVVVEVVEVVSVASTVPLIKRADPPPVVEAHNPCTQHFPVREDKPLFLSFSAFSLTFASHKTSYLTVIKWLEA